MDVGGHEETQTKKRRFGRIGKSSTSDKEYHKEKAIKWYGHVNRRDEEQALRRMLDAAAQGKRQR